MSILVYWASVGLFASFVGLSRFRVWALLLRIETYIICIYIYMYMKIDRKIGR